MLFTSNKIPPIWKTRSIWKWKWKWSIWCVITISILPWVCVMIACILTRVMIFGNLSIYNYTYLITPFIISIIHLSSISISLGVYADQFSLNNIYIWSFNIILLSFLTHRNQLNMKSDPKEFMRLRLIYTFNYSN